MISKQTAALFALRVYEEEVNPINVLPEPAGWEKLTNPLPVTNGFAYGVFRNSGTGEIVISYRGTDGLQIGRAHV